MTSAPTLAFRFLVFVRSDRHQWVWMDSADSLPAAVLSADQSVESGEHDRAVVMEVGSVDAMPMFTFRHRAVKRV